MLNSLFFVKEEELYNIHIENWKYFIKLLFYVMIIKSLIKSL